MASLSPYRVGFSVAIFLGAWQLLWSLLVAFDLAQTVIDVVFWMHFLKPAYQVGTFAGSTALILVGATATVGYALGFVFGVIWNGLHQ